MNNFVFQKLYKEAKSRNKAILLFLLAGKSEEDNIIIESSEIKKVQYFVDDVIMLNTDVIIDLKYITHAVLLNNKLERIKE